MFKPSTILIIHHPMVSMTKGWAFRHSTEPEAVKHADSRVTFAQDIMDIFRWWLQFTTHL